MISSFTVQEARSAAARPASSGDRVVVRCDPGCNLPCGSPFHSVSLLLAVVRATRLACAGSPKVPPSPIPCRRGLDTSSQVSEPARPAGWRGSLTSPLMPVGCVIVVSIAREIAAGRGACATPMVVRRAGFPTKSRTNSGVGCSQITGKLFSIGPSTKVILFVFAQKWKEHI